MSSEQRSPDVKKSGPATTRNGENWTKPTDFVVDAALQVSYGGPALLLLHLGVIVQDLVPQPGQVVHAQLVLLTCQIIASFQNVTVKQLQL